MCAAPETSAAWLGVKVRPSMHAHRTVKKPVDRCAASFQPVPQKVFVVVYLLTSSLQQILLPIYRSGDAGTWFECWRLDFVVYLPKPIVWFLSHGLYYGKFEEEQRTFLQRDVYRNPARPVSLSSASSSSPGIRGSPVSPRSSFLSAQRLRPRFSSICRNSLHPSSLSGNPCLSWW